MSIDQRSIESLLSDKKADFLIPDYQRPYSWEKEQCETLWTDLETFAFPGGDSSKFDTDDEYFLGPIVTYKNKDGKQEVIDGQQRLTTIMLLLRGFYKLFTKMKDKDATKTRERIEKCVWKSDEMGVPDLDKLKILSDVVTDDEKDEFITILKTGVTTDDMQSKYAENYRYFEEKIEGFLHDYPAYIAKFPVRIMSNCILLPIEADSQSTALRIFSTLNDRGMALSDSDIFKAKFYEYYSSLGRKDEFITKWKDLAELCGEIFFPSKGTPVDDLFTRYMYYIRAKEGNKDTTTEALRKFYERDEYKLLRNEETFNDLQALADFWDSVDLQDDERFSQRVLRELLILNYAPNKMWTYFTSVYFLTNKDKDNNLDDQAFYEFLHKTIAFVWAYAITRPGVNALRTPIYAEMINVVKKNPVTFSEFKFDVRNTRSQIENYRFYNMRPITKSMLAWWAFHKRGQEVMPLDEILEIEHIYARNRVVSDPEIIDELGNKALLEKRVNIRASDYAFKDKVERYKGIQRNGKKKEPTHIKELLELADAYTDFTEEDIKQRTELIIDEFIKYLKKEKLTR